MGADRDRPARSVLGAQLQGRFSGRLAEKADEQRLVAECAALGPLLGESQPQTLSTLVRGIATGKVRKFLEDHLPAPGTETQVRVLALTSFFILPSPPVQRLLRPSPRRPTGGPWSVSAPVTGRSAVSQMQLDISAEQPVMGRACRHGC